MVRKIYCHDFIIVSVKTGPKTEQSYILSFILYGRRNRASSNSLVPFVTTVNTLKVIC